MEVEEFSRVIGRILGSTSVTTDERNQINEAMGEADSIEDMPSDIQQLLSRLQSAGSAKQQRSMESRASQLSTVERRIVKQPNICKQCQLNDDPANVPVHPNCDCDVITDSITTGVAPSDSRFLQTLNKEAIDIEMIEGVLDAAGIQIDPATVAIMDMDNVRFADLAAWLEEMQPYLDVGSQYVSIITDDDSDEALAQVQETVEAITEDSENLVEAIKNKKLWFSLAKAVAF